MSFAGRAKRATGEKAGPFPFRALPVAARDRVHDWAAACVRRLCDACGLGHSHRDDLARFADLGNGATVTVIGGAHEEGVIAAALHAELQWMGPATEHVRHALRRAT